MPEPSARELFAERLRAITQEQETKGSLFGGIPVVGGAMDYGLRQFETFANKVDETPVPVLPAVNKVLHGDLKGALWFDASKDPASKGIPRLGDPKKITSEFLRENLPGVTGRVAGSTAEIVLDPLNVMGIGLASKGTKATRAVAELAGRGSLSVPRYLGVLGAAGVGSGVGNEIAGGPGALAGGFIAPWATMSALSAAQRNVRSVGSPVSGPIPDDFKSVIERGGNTWSRFLPTKVGNRDMMLVTREGLLEEINQRNVVSANVKSQKISAPANWDETWDENTHALEALFGYMTETGRTELPITDRWSAGHHLVGMQKAQVDELEWFGRAQQADMNLAAIQEATGMTPNLRYRNVTEGTAREVFEGAIPPDIDASLAGMDAIRRQLDEADQTVLKARDEVRQAKQIYDDTYKAALAEVPSGAKSAARKYVSAVLNGVQEDIDNAGSFFVQRLQENGVGDIPGVQAVFDDVIGLYNHRLATQEGLDGLIESRKNLSESLHSSIKDADETIESYYGQAAEKLKSQLIQVGDREGYYRLTSVTRQDGRLQLALDRVNPRNVKDKGLVNADLEIKEDRILQEAQDRVVSLREQRTQAITNKDRDLARELKAQIAEAEEAVKRAKRPARPVPLKELPKQKGRIVVPLDDATTRLRIFEPTTTTPGALLKAGFRDARTVRVMNEVTVLTREVEQTARKIDGIRESIAQQEKLITPTGAEQGLLAAGILEGVRPEVARQQRRIAALNEELATETARLESAQTKLAATNNRIAMNQQALEATVKQAEDARELAHNNLDQATYDREEYMRKFESTFEMGNDDIARNYFDHWKNANVLLGETLKGQLPGKRLSQEALNQYIDNVQAAARRSRSTFPKPQEEEMSSAVRMIERLLPHQGVRKAITTMVEPHSRAEMNIDPDAIRSGPIGWINRNIIGRGFRSSQFDGAAATYLNGKAAAGHIAELHYGGAQIQLEQWVQNKVKQLAEAGPSDAWASTVKDLPAGKQLQNYIQRAVKPITDKAWQKYLKEAIDEGATEYELEQIHRFLKDDLVTLSLHPELFNMQQFDNTFGLMTREIGRNLQDVNRLANARELSLNMLKREFRQEVGPKGRLPDDISPSTIKNRTTATDLLEIMRKAQSSSKNRRLWMAANDNLPEALRGNPDEFFTLDRMFIDKENFLKTTAANMLERINKDAHFEHFIKPRLKDPEQVKNLKRGEPIARGEWKNEVDADDYAKMRGFLFEDNPTGMWRTVEDVRRATQRMVGSILIGDLSFGSIQFAFLASMSPTAAGRAAAAAKRAALSDEGFFAWYSDPNRFDFINHAINNGLGVGSGTVFGGQRPGNIWEMVPGMRGVGRVLNGMDSVMFDRGMFITKVEALQTNLETVQMMRAIGREAAQEWVDGIPVLKQLHNEADLWQSTNEEVFNAAIRLTNNQFGGLPQSQSLVSADRQRVESILFMVPGFFRARAGLINQASRALRNPQSVEGLIATSLIAREAAFRLAFAGTVATLSGSEDKFLEEVESWQAFDPRRPGGILTGPLGEGGYLGLSWGNQAPRLYAQMLLGFKEGEFNLDPKDRIEAVKAFMSGRQNPILRSVVEQYEGKDFFGRPLATPADRLTAMSQAVLPIWGAEAAEVTKEQIQEDGRIDPLSLASVTAGEFLGVNYRPKSPYDILNNRFKSWQETEFEGTPVDWRNAPADIKNRAKRADVDIAEAEASYIRDIQRRTDESGMQISAAFDQFDQQNIKYDTDLSLASARVAQGSMSLQEWRQRFTEINEDRADNAEYLKVRLDALGMDEKEREFEEGTSRVILGITEYRAVKASNYVNSLTGEIDWTDYRAAQDAVLAKYTPQEVAKIEELMAPTDPLEIRLRQAQADMDTYFEQIPKYKGTTPEDSRYIDFVLSSIKGVAAQARAQGIQAPAQQLYRAGLSYLAENGKIDSSHKAQLAALAMKLALDSNLSLQMRNPQSLEFLVTHPDVFRFYDWMVTEVPRKLQPMLPPEVNQFSLEDTQERELRGISLSAIQ